MAPCLPTETRRFRILVAACTALVAQATDGLKPVDAHFAQLAGGSFQWAGLPHLPFLGGHRGPNAQAQHFAGTVEATCGSLTTD